MMKPNLFQEVALAKDVPEANLRRGDMAVVVDYVSHPSDGNEGAVLEIFNAIGESISVVTVPVSAIESLRPDQMPMVRTMVAA